MFYLEAEAVDYAHITPRVFDTRTGKSSVLGEVFGQAKLLREEQLEFFGREAAVNVPYPGTKEARERRAPTPKALLTLCAAHPTFLG